MCVTDRRGIVVVALMAVGLTVSAVRADEAEDQYAVAAGQYNRGQWKLAAEEFETYLKRFPQAPKASAGVFYLAESLLQLGRHDEAATRFRAYLEREPSGDWARQALFRAGEATFLGGHLPESRPLLEQFHTKYPSDKLNGYTLTYLGQVALAANDQPAAERFFRQCLQEFPGAKTQDECRYGLARSLDNQGKAEEAERLYLAVAGKIGSPYADNAQFHLGSLQYALGRFDEAAKTFDAFDTTFAQSALRPTAQLGRGWAMLKLGRPKEAHEFFQSIASDPKIGIEARYWLGLTEKQQKDWKAAAATLLEAAEADSKHRLVPSIRLHAGDALLHLGDTSAAAAEYDKVLALVSPEGELADDAVRGKAQTALLSKDYPLLDRLTADFVARYPKSPLRAEVDRILARGLIDRKQYQRAAQVLEPMVASSETGEPSLENRYLLSLCYEGLQRPEDALKLLEPVLQSASGTLLADAQLAKASQLISLKRFADAVASLDVYLNSKPEGDGQIRARGLLAVCYARTGQLPRAKEVYGDLLGEHPQHGLMGPITQQLAEAAYDAGDTEWAGELFRRFGREGKGPGAGHHGLSGEAWTQFKAGKLEEAAATFGQLLEKNPDPSLAAEAALARGQILQKLGKPDDALAMFDLVIRKYPESSQAPDALWAAARLHGAAGRHRPATALYRRLADEHPKYAELDAVLYKWAWALHDMGEQKDSMAIFDRLRIEFPQSRYWADATFRLAQRAYDAKDYAQAGKLASVILDAKTEPAIRESTLYLSGQIAAAENKWDEARKVFQRLLNDYPQSSLKLLAEYGIAETQFRQDDYAAAAESLRKLLEESKERHDPWLAVAHLRLAQSLVKEKKWDEAYAVAAPIEKTFPDFKEQYEVDYVLGRYWANKADFDKARQTYGKVIQSPSGTKTETAAKAQFMIAETWFHQKNYDEALREYSRLEILYAYPTWQAAALLQVAKCHEHLGEWKEAAEQYTRLLKTYPQTEFTKEAAERLRAIQQRPGAAS